MVFKQNSQERLKSENKLGNTRAGRLAWLGHLLDVHIINTILEPFREFLLIDLRNSERTIYEKVLYVKKFLQWVDKPLRYVTREDVRKYLSCIDSLHVYKNVLAALKTFFRDFLEMNDVVRTFKFPRAQFRPKIIPTKKELQTFYDAIGSIKEKALFLMYATSGLRRNEILCLEHSDIDLDRRMIVPKTHGGSSKKSYMSFYNEECEEALAEYLKLKNRKSKRIFPFARIRERKLWKTAKSETGFNITPQKLREFFCMEMANLGVQDRFIDAFCGRVPKTILARHYTDYSPQRLKRIYDKAELTVLS